MNPSMEPIQGGRTLRAKGTAIAIIDGVPPHPNPPIFDGGGSGGDGGMGRRRWPPSQPHHRWGWERGMMGQMGGESNRKAIALSAVYAWPRNKCALLHSFTCAAYKRGFALSCLSSASPFLEGTCISRLLFCRGGQG